MSDSFSLDKLGITSKVGIPKPNTDEGRAYLRNAPVSIVDGDKLIVSLPKPQGRLVAKNVKLIHPCFGTPRNIYLLYENQLAYIAEVWKRLCGEKAAILGDVALVTPLLIGGGEFGTFIIEIDGEVRSIQEKDA